MRKRLLFLVLAAVALHGVFASPAAAAPPKLRGMLTRIVSSNVGPPGISVLIHRGRTTDFFYAGVADISNGRRPKRNEHVRIASVAKGFNAYLAVQLAAEGSLSLSDTLGSRIPGVLPNAEGVTLRQLLQHTSGLPEYIQDPEFGKQLGADPAAYFAPLQLTEFVRDDPLEFAPGSRYHYSDTDNIAAGLMEEQATGGSYAGLLRAKIFGPLGMSGSSLPRTVAMPRPFMHGYDVEPETRP
ncbi:MAG TPA: serine hydrolase domain-containing protein, partial [Solirubrobacterales bacterium]